MVKNAKDVFLCHASEDKELVVRPLAGRLEAAGISCWLDEAEIRWGESIPAKVQEGLRMSQFVIVVLSDVFISKPWPQRELNSVLNQEAGTGEVRVLPLLVNTYTTSQILNSYFPLLSDKRYLTWDGCGDVIVSELCAWFDRNKPEFVSTQDVGAVPIVPMPRIKQEVTDQDKTHFLRGAFKTIAMFFQTGLKQLSLQQAGLSVDYEDITNTQFMARIYHHGMERCTCKIWRDGFSGEGIGYAEGRIAFGDNNSYNERLTVVQEGNALGLRMLMGGAYGYQDSTNFMTPTQAAESLWMRFIAPLER